MSEQTTDDIVAQLRREARAGEAFLLEAADEIERLRASLREARHAVRLYAGYIDNPTKDDLRSGQRASQPAGAHMSENPRSTGFDPFAELPPCARCKGERCLPECEYGLGNFICPREPGAG